MPVIHKYSSSARHSHSHLLVHSIIPFHRVLIFRLERNIWSHYIIQGIPSSSIPGNEVILDCFKNFRLVLVVDHWLLLCLLETDIMPLLIAIDVKLLPLTQPHLRTHIYAHPYPSTQRATQLRRVLARAYSVSIQNLNTVTVKPTVWYPPHSHIPPCSFYFSTGSYRITARRIHTCYHASARTFIAIKILSAAKTRQHKKPMPRAFNVTV
jgi:hypothetical protein